MDINVTSAYVIPDFNLSDDRGCLVGRNESVVAMKAVVTVASSLSILGALGIILVSYCMGERMLKKENNLDKETSTGLQNPVLTDDDNATDTGVRREGRKESTTVQYPARLIIVCISAADILVAISHIWGVTNNYNYYVHEHIHIRAEERTECGAQAVLSIFGAISSFLWSDLLAFMAVVMLRSSKKKWFKPANFISHRAFVIYNIICWGIPLLVVCVLGGKHVLGFKEGVGWCYIEGYNTNTSEGREQLGWILFGYEFWVLGSMLFILVMVLMFCIIFCAKKIKKKRIEDAPDEERQPFLESVIVDENTGSCRRSCLILSKPLIMIIAATALIILRIWATFLDFLLYHSKVEGNNFYCTSANLIILAFAGFGNSAQGLVNFLIFVVFTGQCRKLLFSLCGYRKQIKRPAILQ